VASSLKCYVCGHGYCNDYYLKPIDDLKECPPNYVRCGVSGKNNKITIFISKN